jgi:DNA-binding NarL/FixJ family response regulator
MEVERGSNGLIRVGIINPDPLAGAAIRRLLACAGDMSVVLEATDGTVAVRDLGTTRPDVAIVSVTTITRSTTAVIEHLSAIGIAVLTLTLETDDAALMAMLAAGARGTRPKSADSDALIDAVRRLAAERPALSDRQVELLVDDWVHRRRHPDAVRACRAIRSLTTREREVVRGVSRGLTNSEIAAELHCAPTTVKAHLASIFARLAVANRVQLAVLGFHAGMVDER